MTRHQVLAKVKEPQLEVSPQIKRIMVFQVQDIMMLKLML
jgi:hypothetical protein